MWVTLITKTGVVNFFDLLLTSAMILELKKAIIGMKLVISEKRPTKMYKPMLPHIFDK